MASTSSQTSAQTLRDADRLRSRLGVLNEVLDLGHERFPAALEERATTTAKHASERLGHGTSHTVVAFAGATGSGKSSLFNAVVGQTLADVGVKRPTTSQARAAVFGSDATALLDWLEVVKRDSISEHTSVSSGSSDSGSPGTESLDGLVLLDLPDHDSTAAHHRAEAERLVQVVDVLCWVVDPQKYADAALHDEFLQRYSGHGAVTLVVLNQADRLSPDDRRRCLTHLGELVQQDGLQGVRTMAVSAKSGDGVADLQRELAARVAERRALVSRLDADLDWLSGDLLAACGEANPDKVPTSARTALIDSASRVAGLDVVADAVAGTYEHRASLAAGWPPVRWVRKLKAEPLRRIGLGRAGSGAGVGVGAGNANDTAELAVGRTALPAPSAAASTALAAAGRDLVSATTTHFPDHWEQRIGSMVDPAVRALPDKLDRGIATKSLPVESPRWWAVVGVLQRILALALLVGLAWLTALFVLKWFHLPDPPMVKIRGIELPPILAIGGAALGFLLSVLVRRLAKVGGRRRRAQALASLQVRIGEVVDAEVIQPVNDELRVLRDLSDRCRALAR